jgi:hypothetical protein
MHFGPACNFGLSHYGNTMTDSSTLQTVLVAPLKDTFPLQLSLFWRVQFWPKDGHNLISSFLYNFALL